MLPRPRRIGRQLVVEPLVLLTLHLGRHCRVEVELRVERQKFASIYPEAEMVGAKLVPVQLNALSGRYVANIVVAANAHELYGGIERPERAFQVGYLGRTKIGAWESVN